MIVPSDPDYQATKRIKLGLETLDPACVELAGSIRQAFGLRPLNILYEWVPSANRPRLQIVFERWRERESFLIGPWNIEPDKELTLRRLFHNTALFHSPIGPSGTAQGDRAFLILSAFEPVAKAESNGCIPIEAIEALGEQFSGEGVWRFDRFGSTVTCFFRTQEQLERSARNGVRERVRSAYAPLLSACDTFGYIQEPGEHVLFDSKENLDTNYEGNLYYYHL